MKDINFAVFKFLDSRILKLFRNLQFSEFRNSQILGEKFEFLSL